MTSSVPALEPWKTTEEEMFTIRYAKPGIDVCTHRIGIPTAPEVRQSSLVNPRPGIMTGPVTLPGLSQNLKGADDDLPAKTAALLPLRHTFGRRTTPERQCARCTRASRDKLIAPLEVPPEFWQTDQFRDAFAAQHMGRVARAYRTHPYHYAAYGPDGISANPAWTMAGA
ncbi:MAG: hypothetical protein WKF73_11495 [Nocardioidaceae bacterium]